MKNKNLTIIFLSLTIVALTIFNIFSWQKNNENENTILNLKNEMEKLNDDYLTLDANLISLNDLNILLSKELEMFRNPNNKTFFLHGIHLLSKEAKALIFWNKIDRSIMISVENLPKISEKTNYILWAKRENKYLFIEALPRGINGNFLKLDALSEQPENFMITLEKAGANVNPTLSETYLSGNP